MLISKILPFMIASAILTISSQAFAETKVAMNLAADNGVGELLGTVTITETHYGLLFTPNLHGLTPGAHGFHVHEIPSCDNNGMAAGGHFDPMHSARHLGPYDDEGHFGDLPLLYVNADGTSTSPVLAPRIHHLTEISQHALMIHNGGDNYSDQPDKLGGGGARMVCGIIR